MERNVLFLVFCLVSLVGAGIVYAQGFTGPGANPPPPHGHGVDPPPPLPLGHDAYPPPPPLPSHGANPPPPTPPGPGANPPPPPPGSRGFSGQYGFTGPSQTVTVVQAQAFAHRTPVIVRGNIVQTIGADMYTFRDSSGDITVRIGSREWENFGSNISPSDLIEISGELHQRNWQQPEIHARLIRKL